jgi:alcohol dehydrogenase class IV
MAGQYMENQLSEERGVYTFLPAEKVFYGAGSLGQLPAEVERLGCRRAMIITGHSLAQQTLLIKKIETLLGEYHKGTYVGIRQHSPESDITRAMLQARECQADLLISVGGGSPIDAAKAVAYRLAHESHPEPTGNSFLKHIAIPTTLSAAEFSGSAGFTDEAKKSKTGFSDRYLAPRSVILDPEMTVATPMWLWLSSGIRSVDHAVETLYSPGYHPINDVLALHAIQDLFEYLPRSKNEPANLEIRHHCQLAAWMSYFGPASVASASGLSHTIGKRIGATYNVPHGVTSCILLPHVMRYKATFREDAARLVPMARALNLANDQLPDRAAAELAADAVASLVERLGLPSHLQQVNVPLEAFESIASSAASDTTSSAEIVEILRMAW